MARKDFLPTDGKMSNNHNQNKMIREAAKEFGIPEMELSKEIHVRAYEHYPYHKIIPVSHCKNRGI